MNKTKIFIFLCGIVIGVLCYAGYLYYIDMMTKPDLKSKWEKVHVGMHVEKVKKLIGHPEAMIPEDNGTLIWRYVDGHNLLVKGKEVAIVP